MVWDEAPEEEEPFELLPEFRKQKKAEEESGCPATEEEEIPDEAGSLNKILKLLAENGRNVEYMYGFTGRKTNSACMIIRCTNMQKTEEILENNGIHTISQDELKDI